jgi:hypothetical protein
MVAPRNGHDIAWYQHVHLSIAAEEQSLTATSFAWKVGAFDDSQAWIYHILQYGAISLSGLSEPVRSACGHAAMRSGQYEAQLPLLAVLNKWQDFG